MDVYRADQAGIGDVVDCLWEPLQRPKKPTSDSSNGYPYRSISGQEINPAIVAVE